MEPASFRHRLARKTAPVLSAVLLSIVLPAAAAALDAIRHDLKVELSPDSHSLSAVDSITLPEGFAPGRGDGIRFSLHAGLSPASPTPGVRLSREEAGKGDPPIETYSVMLPPGTATFTVEYRGKIEHPPRQAGEESAGGRVDTPGTIGPGGIFLSGGAAWYPQFEGEDKVSFRLDIGMPPGWDAVSQGERGKGQVFAGTPRVAWTSRDPQEDIDLAAGRYTEYGRDDGKTRVTAFLRKPDETLARRYLDAAAVYLAFYGGLIGPYPYPKFAVVENFWETGFAMPSFTLIGPTVLRLPFIVDTSYPHEILHNWWGNGVFVDYERGNWCEGLTSYLADHLLKERQGAGAEYRQTSLQKYADYVLAGRDLPLSEFRSRHGSVSEAVGYGKGLMLFHMLRLSLGDELFVSGLRTLYRDRIFSTASFADVKKSFEKAAGRNIDESFDPWVTRSGAPAIRAGQARVVREGDGYRLRTVLSQVQEEDPFPIWIPIAVTLEGKREAVQAVLAMKGREKTVDLRFPARPLRLDVDPEFDVFRRLDRREIPPALTQGFGAERALILLPGKAGKEMREGYGKLAETLRRAGPGSIEIGMDTDWAELPKDRSVWLLGWENRFIERVKEAAPPLGASIGGDAVRLDGTAYGRRGGSFALAFRHPGNEDMALLWIAADDPAALPGLGRKLPHYHKYSYLAFRGEEPANVAKGRWPVVDSPLTVYPVLDDGSAPHVAMGRLAPRKAVGAVR